ncbi:hypothetical protein HDU76_000407 [Blyttiomyces sp. JEL0837]|nr:hypothetical protein HDU76_000407 [Blyttiomyces sp. JEL0837]
MHYSTATTEGAKSELDLEDMMVARGRGNMSYVAEVAIHFAASMGHLDVVKLMLFFKTARPDSMNLFVNVAAAKGHLEVVRFLVTLEEAIHYEYALRALEKSIVGGHIDVVKWVVGLEEVKARVDHQQRQALVEQAKKGGNKEIAELVEKTFDILPS